MNERTAPMMEPSGDFASGERTEPETAVEEQAASLQGDFAAGERTEPQTAEEELETGLHGDFAAGERTEPLTEDGDTLGSFADSST